MSANKLGRFMGAACAVERLARELAAALTDLDFESVDWFGNRDKRPEWMGKWIAEHRGRVNPGYWSIVKSIVDELREETPCE